MKSSLQRPSYKHSTGAGVLAAAIAVSLASLIAQPAYADHDNDRGARGDHDGDQHGDRGNERRHYEHHRYPVYAPDPIYYPRQESPGISLFIPFWDR